MSGLRALTRNISRENLRTAKAVQTPVLIQPTLPSARSFDRNLNSLFNEVLR